jgi:hypothetical protein
MPSWKKVILSGSDAALNSLEITDGLLANGLQYPTQDNGEFSFIQTDGNGNLSLQYVETLYEQIINGEDTTILKGTPVYVSGSQGADQIVYRADAGDPTKMPVIYIAGDNIESGEPGRGILLGLISGVNTTGYPSGTEIFVGVGGGWTSTRPTGSAIIQSLGIVTKEGNGGQGVILNPGPSNLPNIEPGYVWVGDSDSYPTAISTSSFFTGSFTGSFVGDGSGLTNLPISSAGASKTHTQSLAAFTWSFNHELNTRNPLLQVYNQDYQQIIPNEVIGITPFLSEIRFDYQQAGFAIASTGGVIEITGSTPRLIQTTPQLTWSFEHSLGTKYPGFEVFDSSDAVIIPSKIQVIDENNAEIYFAAPTAGVVIANFSGIDGSLDNAVSASYAATSSYSDQFNIGQTQTRYATITSSINGSNTLFNLATGSYSSAFFKYTVSSGSNARSGEIMSVWNGSTVTFTDNSTTDIGSTTEVTSSVILSGIDIQLNIQTNTLGWLIKSIGTFI